MRDYGSSDGWFKGGKIYCNTNKLKRMKFSPHKILMKVKDNDYTFLHLVNASFSNMFNIIDLAANYLNSGSQIKAQGK